MKIHKIALVSGATVLTLAGMALGACSSSSTPPATAPDGGAGSSSGATSSGSSSGTSSGSSSGTSSGSSSGTSSGSSSGTSSGSSSGTSSGSSSGGTTCAKPPSLHVPVADGGVYCPYSFNDATDAGTQYCSGATPQCCVSPSTDAGASVCAAVGACTAPTTTASQWQCSAPSDCAGYADDGGTPLVCCLISGPVEADTACTGYQKTEGLDSVTCTPAAQCAGPVSVVSGTKTYTDTHYVACESQADCTASGAADAGTCTPVFTIATSIGLCL